MLIAAGDYNIDMGVITPDSANFRNILMIVLILEIY